MSSLARGIAKNAAVVGGATLLSRILGFVRDLIIAFALGAGPVADAFFVAFRLPNLMRRLFGEGSLTMAFVPVYSRVREEHGAEASHVMARSMHIWLVLVLGVLTLVAMYFARPLTLAIAPGFAGEPRQLQLTVELVRICFPYTIFICGVALCMGILNSEGHFLMPALAPCVLNIVLISAALGAVWLKLSVPHMLAYGVLVAGVLQWAVQQPALHSVGLRWFGHWSLKNDGVRRTGRLMLPTVFGAAVYQINILLGTLLASLLPAGSISYLYYADRLVQFPLGVFGIAVSTAALPSLSRLAARKDMDGFKEALNASMRLTLFISIPAAAGLIGLAGPVVELLFQRGAFSTAAVDATSIALVGYAIGLPAFAMVRPLVSAFYALEDTKTPVIAATLSVVVYVIAGAGMMQYIGHLGLALATSLSSWLNAAFLVWRLRGRLGRWASYHRIVPVFLGLSIVIGCGAWGTVPLGKWAVVLIPVWAAVYAVGALLCRIPEATMLLDAVRRRVR
ncbi:murein biosynthesis integral membrane protein MurJ [Desulfobaculum bizertense]|uniref:murein biosynthesis integral membrane protein MurJ n=1 Tax=Desulfobaculum bizertense TaxID=376490 RepID=UPI001F1754E5|nr:murein biosynthesis integral membrane protein MurJ [Desulfobaculum bizertense]UIJ37909.1 murein biosynthesis integral membrane protein MurJ [Desulfobaculum bizertense]